MTRPNRLRVAALAITAVAATGCASATVRRLDEAAAPPHRAGILQIVWRTTLHDHGLFEPAPEECASGVLADGRLVLGSRAGAVVGVAPATGHLDWVTAVSGGIDSEARFDAARGQVYVGADDGSFYAVDPKKGAIRWSYRGKGAIERPAEIGSDLVYVASTADRVVALESATGKWRWQYERDMPEGFTIHGYAGPRLRGNQLLAGFADGYFVSLSAATGEVTWAKSLAGASDQFVDVDTTPAFSDDVTYVASYSGGLHALDTRDGTVRWRLGIEGVGDVTAEGGRLYFVAPRYGL
ncbi:MAG TPA: PQQ-binding-like beta-propeller repeat protein, partial [Polyangia bacterium]|nr:PQQ-binding-like beta-propeller repeat protein [Polyangia bacterium]